MDKQLEQIIDELVQDGSKTQDLADDFLKRGDFSEWFTTIISDLDMDQLPRTIMLMYIQNVYEPSKAKLSEVNNV